MQFSTVIVSLFGSLAVASPLIQERASVCSSALDTPQCCQVGVDGVVELTCESPSSAPTSLSSFQSICAAGGSAAKCCVLPLAGDALLCTDP